MADPGLGPTLRPAELMGIEWSGRSKERGTPEIHEKTPKNQCFPGFPVAVAGLEPATPGL